MWLTAVRARVCVAAHLTGLVMWAEWRCDWRRAKAKGAFKRTPAVVRFASYGFSDEFVKLHVSTLTSMRTHESVNNLAQRLRCV